LLLKIHPASKLGERGRRWRRRRRRRRRKGEKRETRNTFPYALHQRLHTQTKNKHH
jgi:hypothetical protein